MKFRHGKTDMHVRELGIMELEAQTVVNQLQIM